jgi:hypothetical protein
LIRPTVENHPIKPPNQTTQIVVSGFGWSVWVVRVARYELTLFELTLFELALFELHGTSCTVRVDSEFVNGSSIAAMERRSCFLSTGKILAQVELGIFSRRARM